jgi:hypothetical protein
MRTYSVPKSSEGRRCRRAAQREWTQGERRPTDMKRLLIALVAALIVLGAPRTARADSPLTSTDFYEAYLDVPMVARAHAVGHMTPEIAVYLESPVNPLDARVAVVNALGWDFHGKQDADTFARLAWGRPAAAVIPAPLRGDELLVLGYLEVMDDYFHPARGLAVLEKAKDKLPHSLTVAAIVGLARAQRDMDKSFCTAGRDWSAVVDDTSLQQELRPQAVAAIQSYMGAYTCP